MFHCPLSLRNLNPLLKISAIAYVDSAEELLGKSSKLAKLYGFLAVSIIDQLAVVPDITFTIIHLGLNPV